MIEMVVNNVNSILAQMQSIEAMAKSQPLELANVKKSDVPSFSDMMVKAVDTVNETQKTASGLRQRFELGDPSVDLATVMVNAQKSSISFQALVEVRNKLMKAYQDVMNMPV